MLRILWIAPRINHRFKFGLFWFLLFLFDCIIEPEVYFRMTPPVFSFFRLLEGGGRCLPVFMPNIWLYSWLRSSILNDPPAVFLLGGGGGLFGPGGQRNESLTRGGGSGGGDMAQWKICIKTNCRVFAIKLPRHPSSAHGAAAASGGCLDFAKRCTGRGHARRTGRGRRRLSSGDTHNPRPNFSVMTPLKTLLLFFSFLKRAHTPKDGSSEAFHKIGLR